VPEGNRGLLLTILVVLVLVVAYAARRATGSPSSGSPGLPEPVVSREEVSFPSLEELLRVGIV